MPAAIDSNRNRTAVTNSLPDLPSPQAPAAWISAVAAGLACVAVWAGAVWASGHLTVDPILHTVALFGHLAALVVGFGAVLVIDYHGLLWLTGRRTLPEVLDLAASLHPPVWAGTAGLVVTGVFLGPDLQSPLTQVKLLAVLVIALNGLAATLLSHRLAPSDGSSPRRAALLAGGATAGLSQLGWWTALVVGFVNSRT